MKSLINKAKPFLTQNNSDFNKIKLIINSKKYNSEYIEKEDFIDLKPKDYNQFITAIDGGNQNIYNNPQLSIDYVKICSAKFNKLKQYKISTYDFIIITNSINKENNIIFESKIISNNTKVKEKNYTFNSKDEFLKQGIFNANITQIAGKIRRLLEIDIAKQEINNSDENDIILIDGTLQCTHENELNDLKEVIEESKKKKTIIISVAKTNNMYTNKNNSPSFVLNNLTNKDKFILDSKISIDNPLHPAKIFMAKLSKDNIILRLEIPKNQKILTDYFNTLSSYSQDATIIGYPYPLIIADQHARITNEHIRYLKILLLNSDTQNEKNIHELLDNLSF